MKVCEIIRQKKQAQKCLLSFEIFPPKPQNNFDIIPIADKLAQLLPDFISVTYGAGGSTQDKTIEIAGMIKEKYQIETIAHLTCISFTKDQIENAANELKKTQIENILALRGDLPNDPDFRFPTPLHFEHANDLVRFLNSKYKFCFGGAFYPEGHPENKDLDKELKFTLKKIDSGMEFLISQLFFKNENFYRARTRIRESGYNTPLIAGILPIVSAPQIERIANLTGCELPDSVKEILERNKNNPEALKEEGLEYTANQINDLLENNVDGIHIYTMNNPTITKRLLEKTRLLRLK